ncbi:MAG: hypothetical protein ACK5OB_15095 [Pirellula sp.]
MAPFTLPRAAIERAARNKAGADCGRSTINSFATRQAPSASPDWSKRSALASFSSKEEDEVDGEDGCEDGWEDGESGFGGSVAALAIDVGVEADGAVLPCAGPDDGLEGWQPEQAIAKRIAASPIRRKSGRAGALRALAAGVVEGTDGTRRTVGSECACVIGIPSGRRGSGTGIREGRGRSDAERGKGLDGRRGLAAPLSLACSPAIQQPAGPRRTAIVIAPPSGATHFFPILVPFATIAGTILSNPDIQDVLSFI